MFLHIVACFAVWGILFLHTVGDIIGNILGTSVRMTSRQKKEGPSQLCFPRFRGVATVYAIKAAGLAIGIGIGSSSIVLVSFFWGIFVFQEHVYSIPGACCGVFALMVGLLGMSYYSSPIKEDARSEILSGTSYTKSEHELLLDSVIDGSGKVSSKDGIVRRSRNSSLLYDDAQSDSRHFVTTNNSSFEEDSIMLIHQQTATCVVDDDHTFLCGTKVKKRHVGMLAAAFCGLWGGSILAVRENNNNKPAEHCGFLTPLSCH